MDDKTKKKIMGISLIIIVPVVILIILVKMDIIQTQIIFYESTDSISKVILVIGLVLIVSTVAIILYRSRNKSSYHATKSKKNEKEIIDYVRDYVRENNGIELGQCVFCIHGFWRGLPNFEGYALIFTNDLNANCDISLNWRETDSFKLDSLYSYYVSANAIHNITRFGHLSPQDLLRIINDNANGKYGITCEPVEPPKTSKDKFVEEITGTALKDVGTDIIKRGMGNK